ncbi:MAG TPA: hypothetical protein V6D17_11685 [Candidatus Obscuribacterales bacterium]
MTKQATIVPGLSFPFAPLTLSMRLTARGSTLLSSEIRLVHALLLSVLQVAFSVFMMRLLSSHYFWYAPAFDKCLSFVVTLE